MQRYLSEGKLVPTTIDFNKLRSKVLRESFLSQFGGVLKEILRRMFGRVPTPHELEKALAEQDFEGTEATGQLQQASQPSEISEEEKKPDQKLIINGTEEEISTFLDTLMAEHNYMKLYLEKGLEDEEVREAKYVLNETVETFERVTGILWPFT
tara:strand:+ start:4853 stop:5314 length:462 start_codon:yes stop_codon:yes gene_type:complete